VPGRHGDPGNGDLPGAAATATAAAAGSGAWLLSQANNAKWNWGGAKTPPLFRVLMRVNERIL
jgi:hypothetical protein